MYKRFKSTQMLRIADYRINTFYLDYIYLIIPLWSLWGGCFAYYVTPSNIIEQTKKQKIHPRDESMDLTAEKAGIVMLGQMKSLH